MTTRKTIVRALDRAAERADLVDAEPATSKQTWYLAGLLEKLGKDEDWIGCPVTNHNAILTKKRASNYITDLIGDVQKLAA